MSTLLEKLRKKTQTVLMVTKDESLCEQVNAIKKNLYVDTTLATLLHSNHFDAKWNPRVYNKIQEQVDSLYKNKRHENIKQAIFEYLDGWVGKEDVDGLMMFVFPSSMGEISYDPKDSKDFDTLTEIIRTKIIDIFPLSSGQALALAIEYANPSTFIDWDEGWKSLGLKPLNEDKKIQLNAKVKPGDHIRLISVDLDKFPPSEYEHEYSTPEEYSLGRVDMVYQDETPDGEEVTMLRVYFPELETSMEEEGFGDGYSDISDDGIRILVDPYDKYVKSDDVLTEAGIIGGGDGKKPQLPDVFRKNLIRARFEREGGWGRPGHVFILYMTPSGKIMDISYGGQTPKSVVPFKMDQQVTFGELYKFEQNSPFDLRMVGRLSEQDEQLKLFPTGDWEFPVAWDEDSIETVIEGVPEKIVPYIFKQWDEHGIEFRDLKLLGISANVDIAVFLLKRYLQNTNQPVIADKVFDCDDLANLFDDTNSDYNLDYIKEFLCGDDGFWDSEDWYNYEWDDYMTDQIDENNWKTISEIFGGVSKSVAEDILNRSSTSEEVDELIEKYDEEIDEIQNFIVWAHNDEHEWAIKEGMRKDILDKLADHFGADGELYRSDEDGSYSWHFEDDVRNWVNDGLTWDNIERFEFHPDYMHGTLEDSLISTSPSYLNEKTIFSALLEEEYSFFDYCEGKKGECLQVETKFFDGYWHPDYDINETLSDRLTELTDEANTTAIEEQQTLWGNGVMDREKEWCEDDENWLCSTGSENLGFSDLYTSDGFDIIHGFPGEVHLSDLSPEETDTHIPKGTKKYKKLKMKPSLHHGPFNIPLIKEEKDKVRVKTMYEDDNWKYVWPLNDYSFCELAKDTNWCKDGEKYFEGYGTSYILQDKKSDQKWKFDDREVVPGLPSHDVAIRDKDSNWLNTHRFLANKPTLHDMFKKTYTTFDFIKYGVPLDPNILEKFSKTNEFAEAVYKMIKIPTQEAEDELYKFLGDKFTEPSNHYSRRQQVDTIEFNNEGVSLYLDDSTFKEQYMDVGEDDDWYFELGAGRYHNYPGDNCEEFDSEEILYVGHYMNQDTTNNLNKLAQVFGVDTTDIVWDEEGAIDETLGDIIPELWENNLWSILDALGCAVGDSRVKAMEEHIEGEKVLDYEFAGGNRGNEIWELKITYQQLLYIIGEKHINTFSDLEDTEINHIDGGLNDLWYDAYDVDEDGVKNINWEMNQIIDKAMSEYGEDVEIVKKNREKFNKTMTELGFKKQWSTGPWTVEVPSDETNHGNTTITIYDFKPKTGQVEFTVRKHAGKSGGSDKSERHTTTIDDLSNYVVSEELFESAL